MMEGLPAGTTHAFPAREEVTGACPALLALPGYEPGRFALFPYPASDLHPVYRLSQQESWTL